MPKKFTSASQKVGEIGENIATRFLVKQGFKILERNYTQKWGEIDIIAEKDNRLRFVEVKSISQPGMQKVNRETMDLYRPEDNMHPWKLKRIARTIQTYLMSFKEEKAWQADLVVVYLDIQAKKARIKLVSDIIL